MTLKQAQKKAEKVHQKLANLYQLINKLASKEPLTPPEAELLEEIKQHRS